MSDLLARLQLEQERNPELLSITERAEKEALQVANMFNHGIDKRGEFIPSKKFMDGYVKLWLETMGL